MADNVVDNTDRNSIIVLPRVVADQSDEDVNDQQYGQYPAAGRQGNSLETRMFREKWHGWRRIDRSFSGLIKKAACGCLFADLAESARTRRCVLSGSGRFV